MKNSSTTNVTNEDDIVEKLRNMQTAHKKKKMMELLQLPATMNDAILECKKMHVVKPWQRWNHAAV